ncbi:MAG TPA: 2-C-methyl-D-erythritol 2,4-cyclodiphosphate synthase [Planctomycetes bacterium]|nr:2-C-methyl-D-erythritol 2,4-cyclodiphosphate synthase [Planctomycetota bacterium]
MSFRIGMGYDIHRLVEGRPLILGGIAIPFSRGLLGHSDGDAVLHAVTDAILGGAALPDIGELFPDDDPSWEGADSGRLLGLAMEKVAEAGYRVRNVDINVLAERPKLSPFKEAIRDRVASLLRVPPVDVSIKAKTRERLDAVGRGEAIEVHCVALLMEESKS